MLVLCSASQGLGFGNTKILNTRTSCLILLHFITIEFEQTEHI